MRDYIKVVNHPIDVNHEGATGIEKIPKESWVLSPVGLYPAFAEAVIAGTTNPHDPHA
jgi:hypothetical protein